MPNLQHWLNAWVKVNAPQSTPSAGGGNVNHSRHSTGNTGNNNVSKLRTSRHSDRGSSSHNTHSRHGHHNTQSSHYSNAAASGNTAAISVNGLKKAAASVVAVTDNGRDPHDASFGTATLTDSLQSTSSQVAAAVGALTEGLHGEPPQRILSESSHTSSDGVAATFDAELAAIRKFNGKKHRRKLNKTNSYSDLVREKAKDSNTGSSSSKSHNHHSRQNYQPQQNHRRHHHHHHRGADGRDRNRFSQTTITTTQFQQHPPQVEEQFPYHHRGTAPPTLHHPPPTSAIAVEATEGSQLQHCSCTTNELSVNSSSPTETVSTVLRSNQQQQRQLHQQHTNDINNSSSYEEGGEHHSHDSSNSAALFGVAEFFGTQIPDDIRRTSRHVFRAQHGVGDEQPHYLRSQEHYLVSSSSSSLQQPSLVQVPPSHPSSSSLSTDHNNINNNIHRRSNARSSTTINNIPSSSRISTTTTTPATRLNQQHSTRYANAAIPQQPGYPSRYHDNSSHSNSVAISSSSMLVPQQQQEYLRTTRQSSETAGATTTASVTSANSTTRAAERGLVIGGVRLPFFSNHEPSNSNNSNGANHNHMISQQQQQQDHDNSPFGGGRANCPGCEAATADLEYMREMVLRKEYTCSSCNSSRENNTTASTNNASRVHPVLKSTSQQVLGVTERHKKQVEQLMKERNHWQRNMHLRLEKYGNLCQNITTESALRSDEAKATHGELESLKAERDAMAGEIEQLKATVQAYEAEREEHRFVQEKMVSYENDGMKQAREAISKRDETIAKLSARLEKTLDTLSMEREQQRQRRQIFFPPRTKNSDCNHQAANGHYNGTNGHDPNHESSNLKSLGSSNDAAKGGEQQEELKRLRAELLESQRKSETAQLEARQKEMALLFRCETLQRELDNRETSPRAGGGKVVPKNLPSSGKDGSESW